MIRRESLHARLAVLAAWLLPIAAQEVGVDLCACQPSVYAIRLQLNLTCSDATVVTGLPGIRDTTCIIDKSTDANVTDFVPTVVNEIQFLETDQTGNIVRQNLFADGYVDGDIVEYTSFLLGESSAINAVSLPSALSVFLAGQNAAGDPILNTLAIEFSNDCTTHPVLTVGQSIGWIVFNKLEEPPVVPLVCPLVSSMPSEFPSGVPTFAPNLARTPAPVMATTLPPSLSPIAVTTPAPVTVPPIVPAEPTASPIAERTAAPVTIPPIVPAEPTASPIVERTPAPVVVTVPTAAPVISKTPAPIDPAPSPIVTPTAVIPTKSPNVEKTPAPVDPAPSPIVTPISTKSPNVEKTPAPSCELSGKRQPELSAPTKPAEGKRDPSPARRKKRMSPLLPTFLLLGGGEEDESRMPKKANLRPERDEVLKAATQSDDCT